MAVKKKSKKLLFIFSKKDKKTTRTTHFVNVRTILRTMSVMFIAAAFCFGFFYLFKYVKKNVLINDKPLALEIAYAPAWMNQPLKDMIINTGFDNGRLPLTLTPDIAKKVYDNLASISWFEDVTVQTTHESLIINAQWRKPVALISSRGRKYYVDRHLAVMNYIEVAELAIIEVAGMSSKKIPPTGTCFNAEDLAAAVAVLVALDNMDKKLDLAKPLLEEIEKIDVSNFEGRKKNSEPHIILYTIDGKQILWGAQIGKWHRYMEASDKDKLASLYQYYKQFGTLTHGPKYINLRQPINNIPLPTDKY